MSEIISWTALDACCGFDPHTGQLYENICSESRCLCSVLVWLFSLDVGEIANKGRWLNKKIVLAFELFANSSGARGQRRAWWPYDSSRSRISLSIGQ